MFDLASIIGMNFKAELSRPNFVVKRRISCPLAPQCRIKRAIAGMFGRALFDVSAFGTMQKNSD